MRFCFEHTVPAAPEKVFSFFENPERLEVLHEGWSRVRLLHHESQVRVGVETWIEAPVLGIPVVLGFRHTLFEPPVRFGEEVIHGPFSKFMHVHEFIPQDGNTIVRDVLEICLPLHYGGHAAMRHVIAPIVRRMFNNRAVALLRLVENASLANGAGWLVRPTKV